MKKLLYPFLFLFSSIYFAQYPVLSPTNPTINDMITITYGPDSGNNWTYLDPQGDSTLYLYLGLDTNNDTSTWEYNDKWNNCSASNLIPMNYNSATGKFEATFDLRTHNFDGVGGILTNGTTVYNGQYVIRRAYTYECAPSGASISSWQGTNISFGIVPAVVLGVSDADNSRLNMNKIIDGKIYFAKAGNYKVKIFGSSGILLKDLQLNNVQAKQFVALDFKTEKINFCVLEDEYGNKQTIKFMK